ncbi:MAG: caspase family protein, partial [Chloroflexia bacterium]|nr:caspase family protein [Chloroflexia bacterium]
MGVRTSTCAYRMRCFKEDNMTFSQAYALLIGIGSYTYHPQMNVPVTARDANALAAVLRDPRFCGYPETQVSLLSDAAATRAEILAALERLGSLPEESTVLLFYTGHGEYATDGTYVLTTHDTRMQNGRVVDGTGISEQELLTWLQQIKARRLLCIFNACHAGEVSPTLGTGDASSIGIPLPEKTAAAVLATGSGRVIMTACREHQVSYVGAGRLTLFSQALVDGLQGKGDHVGNRGGFISVFDLYSHLYDTLQT